VTGPIAYFISWTCYANWLHGDPRGSVDVLHNVPGTAFVEPNVNRLNREAEIAGSSPVQMNAPIRQIVRETLVDHCRHRGWAIHALNVRTNHVHIVVSGPADPDRAMIEFKAWATRRLREDGLFPADQKIWTTHGSTRYLWKRENLDAAIRYVMDGQGPDLD
jgi:REP element-mobilizing transposase RayT